MKGFHSISCLVIVIMLVSFMGCGKKAPPRYVEPLKNGALATVKIDRT
ncbi:MAG: hypothetical protein JW882_00085 [Deltaproteobacteria bacterium]|nr:hypothetical protein [Deltaproteobacteria bacterium]